MGVDVDSVEQVSFHVELIRNTQLRDALKEKDTSLLQELLERTYDFEDRDHVAAIQELLIEFIARKNPDFALDRVWSFGYDRWHGLLKNIFSTWVKSDLHQALSSAASLLGSSRSTALKSILETHSNSSEVLEFAESIGIASEVEILLNELKIMQSLHDPVRAFDLLFSDFVEDVEQVNLLIMIGESWVAKEGADVFPQLLDIIWKQYEIAPKHDYDSRRVLHRLVEAIAVLNPEQMWGLVLSESIEFRNSLSASVLRAWANQDLEQALNALEKLDDVELRRMIHGTLLRTAAVQDPRSVLENIQNFRVEHRPSTMAWAIREVYRRSGAEEAIKYITALEALGENVVDATRYLSSEWAKQDPQAALAWISSTPVESEFERLNLLRSTLPQLSFVDPHQALTIAKQYSQPKFANTSLSLEVLVLASVSSRGDIDIVRNLLEKISEPAKGIAVANVGRNFVSLSLINEALRIGEELPSTMQPAYFEQLTPTWFSTDLDTLLSNVSSLANENAKVVAQIALQSNSRTPLLTAEEVVMLETIVERE